MSDWTERVARVARLCGHDEAEAVAAVERIMDEAGSPGDFNVAVQQHFGKTWDEISTLLEADGSDPLPR